LRVPKFRFEAGQYCFINVAQISKYQWHPFSLSCAPSAQEDITFHCLESEENTFTGSLRKLVEGKQLDKIKVDGPYGGLSIPLHAYNKLVLVGGGVGVTPMISLLGDLMDRLDSGHKSVPLLEEIHFVWCSRHVEPFMNWFPEVLRRAYQHPKVKLHLFADATSVAKLTGATKTDIGATPTECSLSVSLGFDSDVELREAPPTNDVADVSVDVDQDKDKCDPAKRSNHLAELGSVVTGGRADFSLLMRGIRAKAPKAKVGVTICGPAPLVVSCQNASLDFGFHVHKETFAF
jgi:ferredoxin-NADP reductase